MTLKTALSAPRISKYEQWVGGNLEQAIALYTLNITLSESLYTPLHILEISLRNAINNRFISLHGENWLSNSAINIHNYHQSKITQIVGKYQNPITNDKIVSELSFGFWTMFFGRNYSYLWGQKLRPIFQPPRPLQRKEIAFKLYNIRSLRNRIAHHESIIQLDLQEVYTHTCEIIGWLSPEALIWCHENCRFPNLYPSQPILIGGLINPKLTL